MKAQIIDKRKGKHFKSWKVVEDDSTHWCWRLTYWRMELDLFIYRHTYPTSSDRWVFKPTLIYDRKSRA